MFIFEAYYMNVKDTSSLYECGYKAWNFGPVAPRLYKRYKNCILKCWNFIRLS